MDKLKARLVIEIMGRPPEHIKEALEMMVDRISSEKGVLILNKNFHEPKKAEKAENLFTAFVDLEAEFANVQLFFAVITGYMPSHIEIYEPDKLNFNVSELNSFSNFIVSRMHRYDEIVKVALAEREILLKQLDYVKKGGKIEELIKTNNSTSQKRSNRRTSD